MTSLLLLERFMFDLICKYSPFPNHPVCFRVGPFQTVPPSDRENEATIWLPVLRLQHPEKEPPGVPHPDAYGRETFPVQCLQEVLPGEAQLHQTLPNASQGLATVHYPVGFFCFTIADNPKQFKSSPLKSPSHLYMRFLLKLRVCPTWKIVNRCR